MRSCLAALVGCLLLGAALAAREGAGAPAAASGAATTLEKINDMVPPWLGNATEATVAFQETARSYGVFLKEAVTFLSNSSRVYAEVEALPDRVTQFQEFAKAHPMVAATRVSVFFVVFASWFLTKPKGVLKASGLSAAQQEDLIEDWMPEPLVPPAPRGTKPARGRVLVVDSQDIKTVRLRGGGDVDLLNCASCDFLNFAASPEVKEASRAALEKYTVGSCGPRGFYGTTDAHLSLEAKLAEVFGCSETITYSDGTATVASAIPAFSKRSDVIFLDDGVNHAVQTGCTLSRSRIERFRHNDVLDLERAVKSVCGKAASGSRRYFIVIEGLYANRGDICPLPDVLRIARRYRVRIILDDSLGFGVLGKHGRGTAEHFGIDPLDIDVTLGSMSTSMGSVGGFCVGNDEVVDHQRLSGAGYVFSASLPPFLCVAAEEAVTRFTSDPSLCAGLRSNAKRLCDLLNEARGRFKVVSTFKESPIIHVRLSWHSDRPANDTARIEAARALADMDEEPHWKYAPRSARPARRRFQGVEDDDIDRVLADAAERGVLLARSRYLVTDAFAPANGIRVHVSAAMDEADMDHIVDVLTRAVEAAYEGRSDVPASPARPTMTLRSRR